MSFKMSASDFEMLCKYIDKRAKGNDLTLSIDPGGISINIKIFDYNNDSANITVYHEGSNITPKISVTRGLGDEIK